jgi:hypothetical protein
MILQVSSVAEVYDDILYSIDSAISSYEVIMTFLNVYDTFVYLKMVTVPKKYNRETDILSHGLI